MTGKAEADSSGREITERFMKQRKVVEALLFLKEWSESTPEGQTMTARMVTALDAIKSGGDLLVEPLLPLVIAAQDPVLLSALINAREVFSRGAEAAAAMGTAVPLIGKDCRRCSECVDQPHHWTEDSLEEDGDPVWACKHCDFVMPWDSDDPSKDFQTREERKT